MANLHKFTVQEAVNTDVAGVWDVEDVVTSSATTEHVEVTNYHNVIIDCADTIDVLFDAVATTNCNDSNDLKLPIGVHSLKVPHGVGDEVYLHYRGSASATGVVRVILA